MLSFELKIEKINEHTKYDNWDFKNKENLEKFNNDLLDVLKIKDYEKFDEAFDKFRSAYSRLTEHQQKFLTNRELMNKHYYKLFFEKYPTLQSYLFNANREGEDSFGRTVKMDDGYMRTIYNAYKRNAEKYGIGLNHSELGQRQQKFADLNDRFKEINRRNYFLKEKINIEPVKAKLEKIGKLLGLHTKLKDDFFKEDEGMEIWFGKQDSAEKLVKSLGFSIGKAHFSNTTSSVYYDISLDTGKPDPEYPDYTLDKSILLRLADHKPNQSRVEYEETEYDYIINIDYTEENYLANLKDKLLKIKEIEQINDLSDKITSKFNKAFWDWFGDSKVVNKDGSPKVVYHGTPDNRWINETGKFEPRFGNSESIFFFTDNFKVAKTYADPHRAFDYQGARPGIISCYLLIKNPYIIDWKGESWHGTRKLIEEINGLNKKGARFDSIIIKNVGDVYSTMDKKQKQILSTNYIVFSPNQIKSVNNDGTWDADDNSILSDKATKITPKFNKAFWDWFGDSKVVNEDGSPKVVYHGTPEKFTQFHLGRKAVHGEEFGIFFSENLRQAKKYATGYHDERKGYVIKAYISLKNPRIIEHEQFVQSDEYRNYLRHPKYAPIGVAIQKAKESGHDGLIIKNWADYGGTHTQYIVFSPNQIKSVNNDGTWDADDDSILSDAEQDPFEYQSNNQEIIIHSQWDKGNYYRHYLEAAGDIFREATKGKYAHKSYLREKIDRLKKYFQDEKNFINEEDSFRFSYENNTVQFTQMLSQWDEQPTDNSLLQKAAVELNKYLLIGDVKNTEIQLKKLEELINDDSILSDELGALPKILSNKQIIRNDRFNLLLRRYYQLVVKCERRVKYRIQLDSILNKLEKIANLYGINLMQNYLKVNEMADCDLPNNEKVA